jgi:uroporphyrinogen-III synthase
VRNANGDARALAEAVPAWATPAHGVLLHAAGAEKPSRLAADLAARGFQVQTLALYRATPVRHLPTPTREALEARALDAILLYSPRTAQTLADCLIDDGLRECCRTLLACCISEAAAARLKSLSFRDIRWPQHPDQDGVLALLD